MTLTNDSVGSRALRLIDRARRVRLALAVAAGVFASLSAIGAPAPVAALAGFALIALALLAGVGGSATSREPVPSGEASVRVGDRILESVLAGLPDPVVALDRHGEVIALNARASAIVPGLRPGELVSLALRVPEVLDAFRRAAAGGGAQRVEFFERVPAVRWYEVTAIPIELAGVRPMAASGPTSLVLMTFRDLTPLRRVEE